MYKNLTWEEEVALNLREVKIDPNILSRAMQTTVDNLQKHFNMYEISQEVSTNLKDTISIGNVKDIKILYKEDGEVVIYSSLESEPIHAAIKPYGGYFIIRYRNCDRQPIKAYLLDEKLINRIIGDIFYQVKED